GQPELRADDVHDPLVLAAGTAGREQLDAELAAVPLEGDRHLFGGDVQERPLLRARREDVIDCGKRAFRKRDAPSVLSQHVDRLVTIGSLDLSTVQTDTLIPGRTHERLAQRYEGLPIFGGELVRQLDGRAVISIFGRLYDDVSLATVTPELSGSDAADIAER